jgi:hypothetical protein
MAETMSTEEFDLMRALIKKYAETTLDQWDAWRTETKHGPIYISISMKPEPGASPDAYELY